jgi:hypothetical protein
MIAPFIRDSSVFREKTDFQESREHENNLAWELH